MKVTVTLLFYLSIFTYGYDSKSVRHKDASTEGEEEAFISCNCGKSASIQNVKLSAAEAKKLSSGSVLGLEDVSPLKYWKNIDKLAWVCLNCEISYTTCTGHPNNFDEHKCIKNYAWFGIYDADSRPWIQNRTTSGVNNGTLKVVKRSIENYPMDIHIPIGGFNRTRHERHMDACHYPTSLETSELHCKIYPSSVKCRQRCAFGHTLSKGTEVMRKCKMKDNRWKPGNFEECQPFVDCGMTLVSGGAFTCTTPVVKKGPRCQVKCERYEDKQYKREKVHSCDENAKWTPKLPFCVVKGSGLHLVARPRRRHSHSLSYRNQDDLYYYYDEK